MENIFFVSIPYVKNSESQTSVVWEMWDLSSKIFHKFEIKNHNLSSRCPKNVIFALAGAHVWENSMLSIGALKSSSKSISALYVPNWLQQVQVPKWSPTRLESIPGREPVTGAFRNIKCTTRMIWKFLLTVEYFITQALVPVQELHFLDCGNSSYIFLSWI